MRILRTFDDYSWMGFPARDLTNSFEFGLRPFTPFLGWDAKFDTADPTFLLPVGRGWTEDSLNLRVSMPAITDKDFTVTVLGNSLTIRGERKVPADFGRENMADFALRYGKFERTIDLPHGLDISKMKARFHHGVLDIHIPIEDEAKAKAVPVLVGEEMSDMAAA